MTWVERTRAPSPKGACRRLLARVTLLVAATIVLSGVAWGGAVGVAVRAGTLMTPGASTPPPLVIFSDGSTVDMLPLHAWISARILDDDAIVIREPLSGEIIEASEDFKSIGVVSFESSAVGTLGELLDEPGAVVRFVSSASSADAAQAERFDVAYSDGSSATFIARPIFTMQAPEPGFGSGLTAGALLLGWLARRRAWRRRVPALV